MRAKPIIDILIGVSLLSRWELCHDPLIDLGHDYAEHTGGPEHYIFGKSRDATERTHWCMSWSTEGIPGDPTWPCATPFAAMPARANHT
jgi:hypothetical protein